jgi:flavodoxin
VAELIAEGITSTEGNDVTVNNVKDVKLKKDGTYDLILIGSPAHFGRHVGSVKKFIDRLPKAQLKVKAYAVFDTYIKTDFEKAVKNMENQISEKMPDLKKATPGLSIKVDGMKGPITEEDLPKCKEFGINLTKLIK